MYPNCSNLSYDKIFAQNVKARREAKRLTAKELAEDIMGYPEELLLQVERGDIKGCTVDFLVCLAEALEVPLETLMTNRYFCPHYEKKPSTSETSQESEETEKPYRLYLVVAGFIKDDAAKAHHSMEIIAISEEQAIAKAIELDKADGEFNKDFRYFAYPQPSTLDKKGE